MTIAWIKCKGEISLKFHFIFCGTRVWTQGLHLETLHQPFFAKGFFQDKISWTIFSGWLWTMILLISASWVARITGVSHWHLASIYFLRWPLYVAEVNPELTTYVPQASLKVTILLPLPPRCWECVPPCPAFQISYFIEELITWQFTCTTHVNCVIHLW
jgi:hypothetical protein